MAVPKKLMVVPNPATRDLWRIADSGEMDELEAVLPRAEINARNEHGMTALMRAARHGRVQMVSALLEHGADPNVARSDNFTALSLAAFFGHTETVEVLLKHGARTDVATRYGTSPHMWAKARSFGDVARCIEKRGEQNKPVQSASPVQSALPVQSVVRESVPKSVPRVEVKTLKDPPEIWDLVQEAPRSFNARSAFMTRIRSAKFGFLLRVAVLLLVVSAGTLAALFWKGALSPSSASKADTVSQPIVSPPVTPVATTAPDTAPVASSVVAPENNGNEPVSVDTPVTTPVDIAAPVTVTRRSRSLARSRSTEVNMPSVNTIETAPTPAPPTVAAKPDSNNERVTKNKTTAPLSPRMISPPKSSQPKAKVIQWP